MYKDKEKQKEANRQAKARYKAKQGIPDGQGIPGIPGIPEQGIPIEPVPVSHGLKRGKDIKCFRDLPVDVQATIVRLSADGQELSRRAGIAISYQHTFPDSYYSRGFT